MDINKVFSYQFEDKQWISKLGIGAVILFVPILNIALSGYMIGIMRNVIDKSTESLPNWDDLGKKFTDGLILVAARLVYLLPLIIIFLPVSIIAISGLVSGNNNLQDIGKLIASVGTVLFYCLLCVIIIYSFALSVIFPAIEVIFSREGTFASCFKFREMFNLVSRNAGSFFTAWIVYVVAAFAVGLVFGVINLIVGWIPCLGWIASIIVTIATGIYILTINAYLFGQFGLVAFRQNQPVG